MQDFCFSQDTERLMDGLLDEIHGSEPSPGSKGPIRRRIMQDLWHAFRDKAYEATRMRITVIPIIRNDPGGIDAAENLPIR
jgi:hypothetical protein